jgi:hypothetical protein
MQDALYWPLFCGYACLHTIVCSRNTRALAYYGGERSRKNKLRDEEHKKSSVGSLDVGLHWKLDGNINARIDIARMPFIPGRLMSFV